ncbi:large terminase, partial [Mycobacteroides abscessus subsp. abscessus]|nr:large terminase [Mycobacteroides abscessus subsp. abscessus]MDO3268250.1 large terminase [Mycobacteroides abscessus subsp. abscessus]
MAVLIVPPLDLSYPTLGPQVCQFIEERMVFGPGSLSGQPARLDDEKRGIIYRLYEIYPQGHRLAGRRRF